MQDSKLGSRLKAQLTKFSTELCGGLSRPLEKFVSQMLFGIQASQRVEANTVLCLDLSDIRKEHARKMEYLAPVHDGSTGQVHAGYWLCAITGAEVNGSEILPLYQKLYSAEARDFIGENAEVLAGVDRVRAYTAGRGIWTMDRGGDRKKLLEPLLDRQQRFVIRSTGKRFVTGRDHLLRSVAELGSKCRLRHRARVIKIQDGQEKTYDLRYGVEPIRLAGRDQRAGPGGGGWIRRRADVAADQRAGRSAGLAIAMVDRTNLPDTLENRRVQPRPH